MDVFNILGLVVVLKVLNRGVFHDRLAKLSVSTKEKVYEFRVRHWKLLLLCTWMCC